MLKILTPVLIIFGCFIFLLVAEAVLAILGNKPYPHNPDGKPTNYGQSGKLLKYVVMGDSTAAGQGADYKKGIAVGSAQHLAKEYQVTLTNFSKSGSVTQDILKIQLKKAIHSNPDIVMISVGGNDVTHLTSVNSIYHDTAKIVSELIKNNCNVKIVLTASPDMGSPPKLLQPLRHFAGIRTGQINKSFYKVIQENSLTLAPIAEKTGTLFRKDTSLFSTDKFHPNEEG
ncbi:MAG: GDSL-type esterase/lipase family protein, partial [Patescibacteria group bacterium]